MGYPARLGLATAVLSTLLCLGCTDTPEGDDDILPDDDDIADDDSATDDDDDSATTDDDDDSATDDDDDDTAPAPASADRHVYLDLDGDGQLDDCPNPEHNAHGTSNTDPLFVCSGGTGDGLVVGTAAGRISETGCSSGGGATTPLVSGAEADVDGDGALEAVYGHPQACVWHMAPSDSCEVHAGIYGSAGARADADALSYSMGGDDGCDKHNCWYATVVAYGYGPNLDGDGYGTDASPGYLRGADVNGSIDTWDTDGDRVPDTEPGEPDGFAVVFGGDLDGDGQFDPSTGDDSSVDGDAYYAVQVGCNSEYYDFCDPAHPDGVQVDTDADGVFDAIPANSRQPVDHFVIRDIEFTGYNGGHADSGGCRAREGMIALEGTGATDGLVVEHVYVHDNDYSAQPSHETWWSTFSDSHNGACTGWTEIRDSTLVQNNEKVIDDDCGGGNPCGCPKLVHDNLIVRDVTSPQASNRNVVFAYLKSIDSTASGAVKAHRIYNNDFVFGPGDGWFLDLQAFGNSMGTETGELWIYGNLFRELEGSTANMERFWAGFCGDWSESWQLYFFNNSFDLSFGTTEGLGQACIEPGEQIVEKNNAYFSGATNIRPHQTVADTDIVVNELCSVDSPNCAAVGNDRAAWWTWTGSATAYDGPTQYAALANGPLDDLAYGAPCDPDADGVEGVDYDGDGVNDTTWTDLAGHTVECLALDSPLDVGAIQSD